MSDMPSVIDPELLRQLLGEQIQRGEISRSEAVRCWNIHALPMVRWERRRRMQKEPSRPAGAETSEKDGR